jgi:predicted outer membrane protein
LSLAVGLATLVAFSAPANAQFLRRTRPNSNQPAQQRVTANKPVTDGANYTDREIASWLAICNQKEVVIAQLAANKTNDKQVREFADMMVRDHSQTLQQLARFGGQPTPATDNRQGFDFLTAKRQIADQCVAAARKDWDAKKDRDADICYMGHQIVGHEDMLHTQQVLRQYASAELQQVIDQGINGAQSHLDRARQIMDNLAPPERQKK